MTNHRPIIFFLLCIILISLLIPASAQDVPPEAPPLAEATLDLTAESTAESAAESSELTPYRWHAADLAVLVPPESDVDESHADGRIDLVASEATGVFRFTVLTEVVADEALYDLLHNEMVALGLVLTTYERLTLYGRLGWRIDAYSLVSNEIAAGRIGRLPDDRPLLIIAYSGHPAAFSRWFDAITYGLTFGAEGSPEIPETLPPDRVGGDELMHDLPVQGILSESAPSQTWKYAGTAGEIVTFSAVDLGRASVFDLGLDMAIRVIAPDGAEIAYNDDQLSVDLFGAYDAQIPDLRLPQDGSYTIQVEWVQGAGAYTLGARGDQPLVLDADGSLELRGSLEDVFPVERWVFEVRADQQLSFTMFAETGDLDPALELLTTDGQTLAYNDDSPDTSLGTNAQLNGVTFPGDGIYILEASRFSGSGEYRLIVVATN
jgi:hypothetical protein